MTTAKPNPTRNRQNGSRNAKNDRSVLNCASFVPKACELRKSSQVRHSPAADPAARNPSSSEPPMRITRRNGSRATR